MLDDLYKFNPKNVAWIEYYYGTEKDVVIPNVVNRFRTSRIGTEKGENFFCNNPNVRSIELPETVTRIYPNAFCKCKKLQKVNMPKSINEIGKYAFAYTKIKSVDFKERTSTIPIQIESRAFQHCFQLESVHLSSMCIIKQDTFMNCRNLKELTVDPGNTWYYSTPNNDAIIEKSDNFLVVGCSRTVIPDGVEGLDDYAFYGCKGLTRIEIPDSVYWVGEYAFDYCDNLKEIIFKKWSSTFNYFPFPEKLETIIIKNVAHESRSVLEKKPYHIEKGCFSCIKNLRKVKVECLVSYKLAVEIMIYALDNPGFSIDDNCIDPLDKEDMDICIEIAQNKGYTDLTSKLIINYNKRFGGFNNLEI